MRIAYAILNYGGRAFKEGEAKYGTKSTGMVAEGERETRIFCMNIMTCNIYCASVGINVIMQFATSTSICFNMVNSVADQKAR